METIWKQQFCIQDQVRIPLLPENSFMDVVAWALKTPFRITLLKERFSYVEFDGPFNKDLLFDGK